MVKTLTISPNPASTNEARCTFLPTRMQTDLSTTLSAVGLSIMTPSGRTIIRNLDLSLTPGTKLAVIGAEGSGKSSLLKALARLPLNTFQVTGYVKPVRAGYLAQSLEEPYSQLSPLSFLLQEGPAGAAGMNWELYPDAERAVYTVGLPRSILDEDRPLVTLSGGENVKLRTAKLIMADPEVMLLDEPTNYLDIPTLLWLEQFIRQVTKPMAFVSHDERLIKACANKILFLQHFEFKNESRYLFSGEGYKEFLEAKEAEFDRVEKQLVKHQTVTRKLKQQYVEKESKSDARARSCKPASMAEINKANQAQAKIKAELAKLRNRIEEVPEREPLHREEEIRVTFPFSCAVPAGKKVVDFSCATLAYGEKVCARDIHLEVTGPEKVVIIGRNGVGKSTFLRRLENALGLLPGLRVGYMPQDPCEILADPAKKTVEYLDEIQANQTLNRTTLRRLNFERSEMSRCVSQLSGGQRIKLLFARVILSGANVVLMDEPTANLSPLSRPALTSAVKEYPGAIIAISHDLAFIEGISTSIYEMTLNGLHPKTLAEIL